MRVANRKSLNSMSSCLGLLVFLLAAAFAPATARQNKPDIANGFRWIDAATDPQLWQQIQTAFRDELAPDEPKDGPLALYVYRYKYLDRVGIVGHSALVVISGRPKS